MASMETIVQQYYALIVNSNNRLEETRRILSQIDELVYEGSNQRITLADKIAIIKSLKNKLSPYEYKQFSNNDYLNLISVVLGQLEQQQNQSSSQNNKK